MAAQYKTRCPHCAAQFKIGVEQLKQAQGKVRCGSCLEVFLATQNLVDEQGNPVKVKQKRSSGDGSGQQQTNRQAGAGRAHGSQESPTRDDPDSGPGQEKQAPEPGDVAGNWTLPEDEASETSPLEESESIQDRDPAPANNTAVSLGDSEISESLLSMDEEGGGLGDDDFTTAGGGGDADESWAEQLLEELEDDDAPPDSGENEAQPPAPENMSLLDEWPGEDAGIEETPEARGGQQGPAEPLDDDTEPFSLDLDDGAELDYIDIPAGEEPAQPSQPSRPGSGGTGVQWLKWSALSLLAVVVLAVQYLGFNYRELARLPDWRPFYTQICDLAGCTLPRRAHIEKLRGANLVVRSHPDVDNALVVDAIVFNEAQYPQPFPDLELTFSSMEEEPVASRRFTPDEYRAGELEDQALMPPDVPVHVSFEILDPGAEAVNYNLRFHPPAGPPGNTDAAG
jgi:predicted Zn finger-like uncharacterized protein